MKDQTIVITGATAGIGRAAALELARRGARVVLTARSKERGEQTLDEIRSATGNDRLDLRLADLSRLSDVRRLAEELLDAHERIDVLVNNAGLVQSERRETEDGHELTFQVNHLAPFLLTHLLLERLTASVPARIVNVASGAHQRGGPLDFDDLMAKRSYDGWRQYCRTKLANVHFTRELARRIAGTDVTTNAMHPGVVRTGWGQDGDARGVLGWALWLMRPFMRTPEKGAETIVHLAGDPSVAGVSGEYFIDCRVAPVHADALDDEAARRLWDESERLVGIETR